MGENDDNSLSICTIFQMYALCCVCVVFSDYDSFRRSAFGRRFQLHVFATEDGVVPREVCDLFAKDARRLNLSSTHLRYVLLDQAGVPTVTVHPSLLALGSSE